MTAVLNDESAPMHCGVVSYDAALFARLLHIPKDIRIDQITQTDGKVEMILSGSEATSLPLVEPGFPIPNVQLIARVDEQERVIETRVIAINEDLPGYDAGVPVAPEGDD